AAERDEPQRAATLLGHAGRLRDESGVEVPAFQHADVTHVLATAVEALGADALLVAFDRGKQAREVMVPTS
ncbi:MAG: hypothetical protein ABIV94_08745, partial [Acidimicrobiales bacterium]